MVVAVRVDSIRPNAIDASSFISHISLKGVTHRMTFRKRSNTRPSHFLTRLLVASIGFHPFFVTDQDYLTGFLERPRAKLFVLSPNTHREPTHHQ